MDPSWILSKWVYFLKGPFHKIHFPYLNSSNDKAFLPDSMKLQQEEHILHTYCYSSERDLGQIFGGTGMHILKYPNRE